MDEILLIKTEQAEKLWRVLLTDANAAIERSFAGDRPATAIEVVRKLMDSGDGSIVAMLNRAYGCNIRTEVDGMHVSGGWREVADDVPRVDTMLLEARKLAEAGRARGALQIGEAIRIAELFTQIDASMMRTNWPKPWYDAQRFEGHWRLIVDIKYAGGLLSEEDAERYSIMLAKAARATLAEGHLANEDGAVIDTWMYSVYAPGSDLPDPTGGCGFETPDEPYKIADLTEQINDLTKQINQEAKTRNLATTPGEQKALNLLGKANVQKPDDKDPFACILCIGNPIDGFELYGNQAGFAFTDLARADAEGLRCFGVGGYYTMSLNFLPEE